jgi:hypothetical protein
MKYLIILKKKVGANKISEKILARAKRHLNVVVSSLQC